MKLLQLSLVTFAALTFSGAALAQNHAPGRSLPMHSKAMVSRETMMKCCMAGLSPAEQKIAMRMGQRMTPAQKAVMHKRMEMCMSDKHKGMDMKHMDHTQGMAHMMSGLSRSEQKTLQGFFMSMSPAEMAVGQKMMENCCTYGIKHGK